MAKKIVLVRHGRSGHVHTGFIDHAGFRRWREAYEAAGIDEQDKPPPELKALAVASGIILASTAPRAMESAKRLDAGRDITTSRLLHELELAPPSIRGIRMPLAAWAVAVGLQWGIRAALRRPYVSPVELRRSREAAEAEFLEEHVEVGSQLMTDEGYAHPRFAENFVHDCVNHEIEHARGNVHCYGATARRTYGACCSLSCPGLTSV